MLNGCCCCACLYTKSIPAEPDPCTHCRDTPTNYLLDFSGVSFVPCVPVGGKSWEQTFGSVNGLWDAANYSTICKWHFETAAAGFAGVQHGGTTCSALEFTHSPMPLFIDVFRTVATMRVILATQNVISTDIGRLVYFDGTAAISGNCCAPFTVANQLSAPGTISYQSVTYIVAATGGSVEGLPCAV